MNVRAITVALAISVFTCAQAYGQSGANDFFGSSVGGQSDGAQGSAAAVNATAPGAPAGDYTSDEKRMQKKYRANVKDAEKLVAKAEKMIKDSDPKLAKKGRILKEIGEKRLAELKANNPFPELAAKDKKFQ